MRERERQSPTRAVPLAARQILWNARILPSFSSLPRSMWKRVAADRKKDGKLSFHVVSSTHTCSRIKTFYSYKEDWLKKVSLLQDTGSERCWSPSENRLHKKKLKVTNTWTSNSNAAEWKRFEAYNLKNTVTKPNLGKRSTRLYLVVKPVATVFQALCVKTLTSKEVPLVREISLE